jgi:hypothetical protein
MNKSTINSDLIENVRKKINGNSNFLLGEYVNVNGKNHWSLICSCMDWITVAITFLQSIAFNRDDINVMTMQVYSYISAIDIVYESINQLHRVIEGNQNLPFKGRKTIFADNLIFCDDNAYFKQIRAAFGAHPVNLNDVNGKWFASWPNHGLSSKGNDFELFLYSCDINKPDIIFGLKFAELNDFLLERYSYLLVLDKEIDKQFEAFRSKKIAEQIENSNNLLEQLKILKVESEKRLNSDYYRYAIDELITIFSNQLANSNLCEKEQIYKDKLGFLIEEIKSNLQSMDLKDFLNHKVLYPDYPSSIHYPVSKLFNCGFDALKDPFFWFYIGELNEHSSGKYEFGTEKSSGELLLKIKIMLYFEDEEKFT